MVCLLWCAWIIGLPLTIVFLFMLTVKEFSSTIGIAVAAGVMLTYLIAPGALIRFYRSEAVRRAFEASDAQMHRIERLPMPVLVAGSLLAFFAVAMHAPLFFNGLFPVFGRWLSGISGFWALELFILILAVLSWGVLRQKTWAWWGGIICIGLLTCSLLITLTRSSLADIYAPIQLPAKEIDMLKGIPLQGFHLAVLAGIPPILTLAAIIKARPHLRHE
jgi:hypothetical protein